MQKINIKIEPFRSAINADLDRVLENFKQNKNIPKSEIIKEVVEIFNENIGSKIETERLGDPISIDFCDHTETIKFSQKTDWVHTEFRMWLFDQAEMIEDYFKKKTVIEIALIAHRSEAFQRKGDL